MRSPQRNASPDDVQVSGPQASSDSRGDLRERLTETMEQSANPLPSVVVVVCTLDEEAFIEGCLRSIQAQSYPSDRITIMVVDGGSTDRTLELVHDLALHDRRIAVRNNPAGIQAAGFNVAIRESDTDIVSLASAHSLLSENFIEECVSELLRSGADNVGGKLVATGDLPVQQAIAAAMSSPFGVGGAAHHYASEPQDLLTVWPGCFRRSILDRVGLFRPDLVVHEDYELNYRIRAAGGRVRFSPKISATYFVRPSLQALARQYFRYGRAKAAVSRAVPGVLRPYHLVPPLFVGGLIGAAILAPLLTFVRWVLLYVVVLYFLLLIVGGLKAGWSFSPASRLLAPVVLMTMHLCWGGGFLVGLVAGPPPRAKRK